MTGIITDRGEGWEQLRYQTNIEGDDVWEDSEDKLKWAVEDLIHRGCTTITIHLEPRS